MSLSHLKEVSELMGEVAELKDKLSRYEGAVRVTGELTKHQVKDKDYGDWKATGNLLIEPDYHYSEVDELYGQRVTVLLLKEGV